MVARLIFKYVASVTDDCQAILDFSCPTCQKGYLRPTSDVGIMGDPKHPSSDTREYVCDNDDCKQRRVGVKINEDLTLSDGDEPRK